MKMVPAYILSGLLSTAMGNETLGLQDPMLSDADEYFYGVGTGVKGRGSLNFGLRKGQFGVQIGLGNNIQIDSNTLGFPVPVGTTRIGKFRTDPSIGLDIVLFTGDKNQGAYFSLGGYVQSRTEVFRDSITGDLYRGAKSYNTVGAFGIGYSGVTNRGSSVGFGYHSQLGIHIWFSKSTR
jgi:hypothetical protein